MPKCLIGLGSNLGDPKAQLARATARLRSAAGVSVTAISSGYRSLPVGGPAGQPEFLNGAAVIETEQSAAELLGTLQEAEIAAGRHRNLRWGPRLIDLDLLLYGDHILLNDGLRVPHPWMAFRPFVLSPANEIAPSMRHPELQWTIAQIACHAASCPKILALAPCSDDVFDAALAHLADIPDLRSIRFPSFNPTRLAGLATGQRIEFMAQQASWLKKQLQPDSTAATVVVGGWWDHPIGWFEPAAQEARHELWQASLEIQRQLNPCVPHVTIGFAGAFGASSREPPDAEAVYRYLRRPGRGPFLLLTTEDISQVMHDLRAVVTGFRSLVQRE